MLKISTRYTNASPADSEYPNGSIKNDAVAGDKTGTPVDKDWLNDRVGFDEALRIEVGGTASGSPDTALASDRLNWLKTLTDAIRSKLTIKGGITNVETYLDNETVDDYAALIAAHSASPYPAGVYVNIAHRDATAKVVGSGGKFYITDDDHVNDIANDPQQGVYIDLGSGITAVRDGFDRHLCVFWGVVADNVTDDDIAGQAALDYQYYANVDLYLPIGTIKSIQPWVVWCNNSDLTKTAFPKIIGAGRGISTIRRNNRVNSSLINHTTISSVLIIANDYTKDGNTVDTITSALQTASYFGRFEGFTLEGDSPDATRVAYGIYTLGIFYWEWDDVEFKGVETAAATEHWNVFCSYRKLEMQLTGNGCDFGRTTFGGNSNLYFELCHCNGINGFCYSILANALMIGCTIDGGGGSHYVINGVDRGAAGILRGGITLIDCKSESQATFDTKKIFDLNYGSINAHNCSIEIPTLNFTGTSTVIEGGNYSTFDATECRFNLRTGGPASTPGMLHSMDGTSRASFDSKTFINTEWFDQYKKVFYNQSDKKIIANRDKNGVTATDITKFIWYVSGAVPAGERTVTTLSFASDRIQIACVQSNGHAMESGIMFNQALDLTDYSKIYFQGDVDFVEGDVTGVNLRCYLNTTLVADGTVGVGTAVPITSIRTTSGELPGNYNDTDFNRYVDVSDLVGVYYIGFGYAGININANIQELSLIR